MTRTVVLISGARKRTYPLADGVPLKETYWIDGECWTVVAAYSTEDITVPQPARTPQ